MHIPQRLLECDQWIAWTLTEDGRKVPLSPVNDPSQFKSYSMAKLEARRRRASGVGFVLTEDDDILVIDLDKCIQDEAIEPDAFQLITEAESFCETSQSGNGVHIFGTGSPNVTSGYNGGGIECYSQGRYIAFTGDHLKGTPLELNDISELYNRLHKGEDKAKEVIQELIPESPVNWEERGRRLCETHEPAIDGQNGHGTTYKLALALVRGLCIDPYDAICLMYDHYNDRCQPEWSRKELEHKAYSAFKDGKMEWGYLIDDEESTAYADRVVLNLSEPNIEDADDQVVYKDVDALTPYGELMDSLVDFGLSRSGKPRPKLVTFGAIQFLANCIGQEYRAPNNLRTNLYSVVVAESGTGKNQNLDWIWDLSEYVPSVKHRLMTEPGTVQGLSRELGARGSVLSVIDEFHGLLRDLSSTKDQNRKGIADAVLSLWSAAKKPHWSFRSYADATKNYVVSYPHLGILGLTTPVKFFECLSSGMTLDGTLGRCLVYHVPDVPVPFTPVTVTEPSPSLIDALKSIFDDKYEEGKLKSETKAMNFTPEANEMLTEFGRVVDEKLHKDSETARTIWARAYEKVVKVAMVGAFSENYTCPVVTPNVVTWAIDLVVELTNTMVDHLSHHYATSRYEAKAKKVADYIRKSQKKGRTATQLANFLSVPARERNEILELLRDQGKVETVKVKTGGRGRPTLRHYAVEFAPEGDE